MNDRTTTTATRGSRRGRPRAGEREERRHRVIEAAFDELLEHGYDGVTMLGIARRAGASKETLYSWFGSKPGLFEAVIRDNADASAQQVHAALAGDGDPQATLTGYAIGLLSLLTSERSVALNRASMTSPDLAAILLESGRHRVGPIVEEYLARLADEGHLATDDPAAAFSLLYGLVVQDTQIRVLLGERPPSKAAIARRADEAVMRFLDLVGARE
ncbi:MAG: TetR/AcrR family transcriptional regulator [Ilumatobacter sp.]|uniref:TetR/AcrR family transcriptional regulator n=1 Tax=Ilumatobacter sp. TaxID=1967498 RepID=UPI00262E2502|nr:TetR/AcrR family transcriptional regulator [Ilumatobacter sp.]MDJ0767860.1 TetR/AcrR family transcriptional regulator [Ilumatobacter sp.]